MRGAENKCGHIVCVKCMLLHVQVKILRDPPKSSKNSRNGSKKTSLVLNVQWRIAAKECMKMTLLLF